MSQIIKTLTSATDTLTIDNSGYIREWTMNGKPIFVPYSEKKQRRKIIRRGGSFICFPFFGEAPAHYSNLPRHGFLRDIEFFATTVHGTKGEHLSILRPLKYPAQTAFPYPLFIEVLVALGRIPGVWTHTLRVVNLGTESLPINPAFHPYFFLPNGNGTVQIAKRMFYIRDGKYEGLRNSLEYSPTLKLHDQHIIYTTTQGEISLKVCSNFNKYYGQVVLWSDNPKKYVCIEPITHDPHFLGTTKGLWLKPGLKNALEFSCTYKYKENIQ